MSEMTIAVAIWDGVEELDVVGPYEVLASWGAQSNGSAVHVYTVAERADEVRCAHGLRLLPDRTWSDVDEIDVLVLPGGNARPQAEDERVLDRVRGLGENGTLMTSDCFADEIAIDLSGAKMRMNAARPAFPTGEGEPAITARNLNLVARPVSVAGAAVHVALEAQDIVLHQNRDTEGNIFLLLHRAENGRLGVSISLEDLETLITEAAKVEAGKHGIVIEDVLLNLTSRSPQSVGAELRVQGRKLFVRTTIQDSRRIRYWAGATTGVMSFKFVICNCRSLTIIAPLQNQNPHRL